MSTVGHSNNLLNLVERVASLCKQADESICTDEARRAALLRAAKQLVVALEAPADAVYQTAFLVLSLLFSWDFLFTVRVSRVIY